MWNSKCTGPEGAKSLVIQEVPTSPGDRLFAPSRTVQGPLMAHNSGPGFQTAGSARRTSLEQRLSSEPSVRSLAPGLPRAPVSFSALKLQRDVAPPLNPAPPRPPAPAPGPLPARMRLDVRGSA